MQWLQSVFGGESAGMTLLLLVLGLAIALVLLFWVFRKIAGNGQMKAGRNRQPRLSVTDAAAVDDKRRLVLVRRDDVEHLVMIGGASDILIEANITMTQPAVPAAQPEARDASPQSLDTGKTRPAVAEPAPIAPVAIAPVTADPLTEKELVVEQSKPSTMSTIEEIRERAAAKDLHSSAVPEDLEKQASANTVGAQQGAAVHSFPSTKNQDAQIPNTSGPAVQSTENSLEKELNAELGNGSAEVHSVDSDKANEPQAAPSVDVAQRTPSEDERKRKASATSGNKEVEDEMQKLLDELANT